MASRLSVLLPPTGRLVGLVFMAAVATGCARGGPLNAGPFTGSARPSTQPLDRGPLPSGCPTLSAPPGGGFTSVDYVDFVEVDGHQYIAGLTTTVPIGRADVGQQVLLVRCSLAQLNSATGLVPPKPRDGDAAMLAAGTPIYAVKGWPTSCRLAALRDGHWQVYLAYQSGSQGATPEPCALHHGV